MRRRRYIALSGTALTAAFAGCGSGDDQGDGSPEDGDSTETEGSDPSPTDATATRTATPTDDGADGGAGGAETDSDSESDAVSVETSTDTPQRATATPTPTPDPTPTSTPTPTPSQDGESYTFSGSSDGVTDAFDIEGGFTSFDMAHDGESNFQVELVDTDSGDTREYLANEIGEWEGLLPYEVPAGEYVLDVTADGSWEIIVRQPRHTLDDAESVPAMGEDEYPNYLGPIEFEGFHRVSGRYEGDSNFAVWLLDEDGGEEELLFNEVGEFEGETTTNYEGLGYIRVEATGPWRIDVE